MFKDERHDEILKLINQKQSISVKVLCEHFKVSVVTIRSDLKELEGKGKILRTHGGALMIEENKDLQPFSSRRKKHAQKKADIGKVAAEIVQDAEVVYIDGGSTAAEIAQFLTNKQKITVITPSVEVAYHLVTSTNINVYLLNGFVLKSSLSTIGSPYEGFMSEWNIAKAFFGAAGLTIEDGLTDLLHGFIEQKKVIRKKAKSVIAVIDSSKWGTCSLGSFASLDEINTVITDKSAPKEMIEVLQQRGIEVIIA